jgi:Tfp pilus assembly protein PilZ
MMGTDRTERHVTATIEERFVDDSGREHSRALRRRLPFGRGAVLVVGDRSHIVGLADLSVGGAYLRTVAPVAVGEAHVLRLLLPPERTQLELKVEVVRVAQQAHESANHPRGVAVRFADLDDAATQKLRAFIARGRPKDPATS